MRTNNEKRDWYIGNFISKNGVNVNMTEKDVREYLRKMPNSEGFAREITNNGQYIYIEKRETFSNNRLGCKLSIKVLWK